MGALPVPGGAARTPRMPCGEDEGVSHESKEHHQRKLGLGYWAGIRSRELFARQGDPSGYAATEGTARRGRSGRGRGEISQGGGLQAEEAPLENHHLGTRNTVKRGWQGQPGEGSPAATEVGPAAPPSSPFIFTPTLQRQRKKERKSPLPPPPPRSLRTMVNIGGDGRAESFNVKTG